MTVATVAIRETWRGMLQNFLSIPKNVLVMSGKLFRQHSKHRVTLKLFPRARLIRFFQLLQAGFIARFTDLTPLK